MEILKKSKLSFWAIILFISCTNSNKMDKNLEIIPIPPNYSRYIEGMHTTFREDFFALKNLNVLNETAMKRVDSFIRKYYNKSCDSFGNYSISFYKYGRVNEKLQHNGESDNSMALYSNDELLTYEWNFGRYMGTFHYKNGEIIGGYEHRPNIPSTEK